MVYGVLRIWRRSIFLLSRVSFTSSIPSVMMLCLKPGLWLGPKLFRKMGPATNFIRGLLAQFLPAIRNCSQKYTTRTELLGKAGFEPMSYGKSRSMWALGQFTKQVMVSDQKPNFSCLARPFLSGQLR